MEKWYGVFSPKGELESVEVTEYHAKQIGEALSPKVGNTVQMNRTIEPVFVIRGSIGAILAKAADDVFNKKLAAFKKEDESVQAELDFAREHKQTISGDYWHKKFRAEAEVKTIVKLAEALQSLTGE